MDQSQPWRYVAKELETRRMEDQQPAISLASTVSGENSMVRAAGQHALRHPDGAFAARFSWDHSTIF